MVHVCCRSPQANDVPQHFFQVKAEKQSFPQMFIWTKNSTSPLLEKIFLRCDMYYDWLLLTDVKAIKETTNMCH